MIRTSIEITMFTRNFASPSIIDNLRYSHVFHNKSQDHCVIRTTVSFTGLSLYNQARNPVEFQYVSEASTILFIDTKKLVCH